MSARACASTHSTAHNHGDGGSRRRRRITTPLSRRHRRSAIAAAIVAADRLIIALHAALFTRLLARSLACLRAGRRRRLTRTFSAYSLRSRVAA